MNISLSNWFANRRPLFWQAGQFIGISQTTIASIGNVYRSGLYAVFTRLPFDNFGFNKQELYDAKKHCIVTAASCTTNCFAPIVKVLHQAIGILRRSITTLHDVTNKQTIVDRPAKDLRRARSALNSLIPTISGSATTITLIYRELTGRLTGHAVRVPLLNASLADCVFEMQYSTTVIEVNAYFEKTSTGHLAGILGCETRSLVSADYVNDPNPSSLMRRRPWLSVIRKSR